MAEDSPILAALEAALEPLGFRRHELTGSVPGLAVDAVWRRRTWNTNRAVAVVRVEGEQLPAHPGELAQAIKIPLGKLIGYFPFFYGLGLQLVVRDVLDDEPVERLADYTDKIDNQRCLAQSIHVIDEKAGQFQSVRTWGQVITGRFQDAIEAALETELDRLE